MIVERGVDKERHIERGGRRERERERESHHSPSLVRGAPYLLHELGNSCTQFLIPIIMLPTRQKDGTYDSPALQLDPCRPSVFFQAVAQP